MKRNKKGFIYFLITTISLSIFSLLKGNSRKLLLCPNNKVRTCTHKTKWCMYYMYLYARTRLLFIHSTFLGDRKKQEEKNGKWYK